MHEGPSFESPIKLTKKEGSEPNVDHLVASAIIDFRRGYTGDEEMIAEWKRAGDIQKLAGAEQFFADVLIDAESKSSENLLDRAVQMRALTSKARLLIIQAGAANDFKEAALEHLRLLHRMAAKIPLTKQKRRDLPEEQTDIRAAA